MAQHADGRLLVVGTLDDQGVAARLAADGNADPSFDSAALTANVKQPIAVAVDAPDRIVVAGHGPEGVAGALARWSSNCNLMEPLKPPLAMVVLPGSTRRTAMVLQLPPTSRFCPVARY